MKAYNKSILEYQDVRDAVDYAREEGREEGIEEGIKEGKEKERIEIAKKCLQKGMDIEDIAALTELTPEQIKVLI